LGGQQAEDAVVAGKMQRADGDEGVAFLQERLDAFDDAERESTVRWLDTAAGPLLTEAP